MLKQKKKTIILVCVLILLGIGISIAIRDIIKNGYAYYDDGWMDTPEKAVAKASDGTLDDLETLSIETLLDIVYVDNYAHLLFVSESKMLVLATCVQNDAGKWHYHGRSRENALEEPKTFVLNGRPDQVILFSYDTNKAGTLIFGWKYTDTPPLLVEGKPIETKTYRFSIDNKDWSIDYWWIEDEAFRSMKKVNLTYGSE